MLARSLEANGLATILVTNMPYWAEKTGAPRTLAVEFPFGHMLGQPHNRELQLAVLREAFAGLETAVSPGTVVHSQLTWPDMETDWQKAWQPDTPSPIISVMAPKFREMLRQQRKKRK